MKGLRISIMTAVTIQLIGFWLRALLGVDFNYLLVGQAFLAVGFPFIWDMPQKLATVWFPV
jgi:hypothetical protein